MVTGDGEGTVMVEPMMAPPQIKRRRNHEGRFHNTIYHSTAQGFLSSGQTGPTLSSKTLYGVYWITAPAYALLHYIRTAAFGPGLWAHSGLQVVW